MAKHSRICHHHLIFSGPFMLKLAFAIVGIIFNISANGEVTIFPKIQTAYVGEEVRITCRSNHRLVWNKNGIMLEKNVYHNFPNTYYFHIKHAENEDTGTYSCYQSGRHMENKEYSELFVGIKETDRITLNTSIPERYELICKSFGKTKWLFNDKPTFPDNIELSGYYGERLAILKANLQNSGNYKCYGLYKHSWQAFVNSIKLTLHDDKKITPQYVKTILGGKASFSCLSADPVRWKFNNRSLLKNTKINKEKREIYIDPVLLINEGVYECVGTTKEGYIFGAKGTLVVEKNMCSSILPPKHGFIIFEGSDINETPIFSQTTQEHNIKDQNIKVGSKAKYSCQEGYDLINGDSLRLCLSDMKWSGDEPVCSKMCEKPKIKNGYTRMVEKPSTRASKNTRFANFFCMPGYKMVGSSMSTCSDEFEWSGTRECIEYIVLDSQSSNKKMLWLYTATFYSCLTIFL